jgi:hypothetical protein
VLILALVTGLVLALRSVRIGGLGLVLFVSSIGLQVSPEFFASLRRRARPPGAAAARKAPMARPVCSSVWSLRASAASKGHPSRSATMAAIEAGQVLARGPAPIAATFNRVCRKRGRSVAATGLVRKLIVLFWM